MRPQQTKRNPVAGVAEDSRIELEQRGVANAPGHEVHRRSGQEVRVNIHLQQMAFANSGDGAQEPRTVVEEQVGGRDLRRREQSSCGRRRGPCR